MFLLLLLLLPGAVSAQSPDNFKELVAIFIDIISVLIPFVFALTLIVIIWGLTKAWIINAGSEEGVEKGKQIALAGVIALVIMSGIWGILAILRAGLFG